MEFRFSDQVKTAHDKASAENDFMLHFIPEVRSIIADQTADGFAARLDLEHDIGYLYGIANKYDWADRQFIKNISDYIERAIRKDNASKQDPDTNETYMKLIKN